MSTRVEGDGAGAVLIEVDAPPPPGLVDEVYGPVRGERAEKVIAIAGDLFDDGLRLAKTCAQQVIESIETLAEHVRPDEFQVSLAIKLDAEVGAILTKTAAGAQMQVTMKWIRECPPTADDDDDGQ